MRFVLNRIRLRKLRAWRTVHVHDDAYRIIGYSNAEGSLSLLVWNRGDATAPQRLPSPMERDAHLRRVATGAKRENYRPRLGEWIIVYSREEGDEVEQLPGAVRLDACVGELDFQGDPYHVEVTERVLSWLSLERAEKCRRLGLN